MLEFPAFRSNPGMGRLTAGRAFAPVLAAGVEASREAPSTLTPSP